MFNVAAVAIVVAIVVAVVVGVVGVAATVAVVLSRPNTSNVACCVVAGVSPLQFATEAYRKLIRMTCVRAPVFGFG